MSERPAPGSGPIVVFSGGGTGGHLYPALALASALSTLRPDVRPFFVGARGGIEARVLAQRGVAHRLVPVRGLVGVPPHRLPGVLFGLVRSLLSVFALMRRLRPALVVVTGGYAGAPAGLVARLLGIPLALQEQNSVPGLTTRRLARWARQIHVAYPEATAHLGTTARARTETNGNPIEPPVAHDPAVARKAFGLDAGVPVVLVVGGSQGSVALNAAVLDWVRTDAAMRDADRAAPRLQLLWSTGRANHEAVARELAALGAPRHVHAHAYLDDMQGALAAASIVVSRAGAMATSEFLAWGLPAILVPLPTAAADHQTANARTLAEAGAAVAVAQAELDGPSLGRAVHDLLDDPDRLTAMHAAARRRARPDAAAVIAARLAALLPAPATGAAAA